MAAAVWAFAIPWGKTAAGGRPQNPDFHKKVGAARSTRANTLAIQRLDTYIVISMPNRNSTACGVSHFILKLLFEVRVQYPPYTDFPESAAS
ncbi:MAG: hypothetical protein ACYDAH_15315 [Steroidobacteraceae bacterium]